MPLANQVRVFKYRSGKLRRVYDESIPVFEESLREGKLAVDSFDFGRRVALEKELASSTTAPPSNAVFDESGHFIMYPTLVGIKIVNIETNKVVRVLGKVTKQHMTMLPRGRRRHRHCLLTQCWLLAG